MKTALLSCCMMFLCLGITMAQERGSSPPAAPYQERSGMIYADDVVIHEYEIADQRHACLSVAHNGWLFAAFHSHLGTSQVTQVFRSIDQGATWQMIYFINMAETVQLNGLDIVVCGTDESDLTVFLAGTHYFPVTERYWVWVYSFSGADFSIRSQPIDLEFTSPVRDIAIASDYLMPSAGAAPYSVGVAFPESAPMVDVLHLMTSGDGGVNFDHNRTLTTTYFIKNVSVAFGRSNSYPSGRYFLAWDEFEVPQLRLGRIYTAYSEPGFSSELTAPVRIDALSTSIADKCKAPVISSQFSYADNGMGNLTTVILFDRAWEGSAIDYDVVGYFNKESVWTDNWEYTQVSNNTLNVFQPDINFDPNYGNFLVTYCDSTNQLLPYWVQYMDMPAPLSWALISEGYNDGGKLVAPYPKVEINLIEFMTAHVWIRESPVDLGIAMFDAEYNFVGINGPPEPTSMQIRAFPNPCSDQVKFSFYLDQPGSVEIRIYDLPGRLVESFSDVPAGQGMQEIEFSTRSLPDGCYHYDLQTETQHGYGKVMVMN